MGRKVLVVDDEKLIVKGLRFSLEQDDMEVDCAYDGEEALEMVKRKEYDMILLDVMLPKYDGFEVCRQIRDFSDVPVIMLTAKGEDMDKILGLEYGADDYITKPFNILEVKARMKAIMRRVAKKDGMSASGKVVVKGDPVPISASERIGIGDMLDKVLAYFPEGAGQEEEDDRPRVAIVGKPNVGKSSIINRLIGKDRVIVSDIAGTTRDAIDTEVMHNGKEYVFIDTAGLRRKNKIKEELERYSIIRTVTAVERADVVLVVIDAAEGVTEQDAKIAGIAHERGKGVIIVVNKWDAIEKNDKTTKEYEHQIRMVLSFLPYAEIMYVSALTGQRLPKLFDMIDTVIENQTLRVATGVLNEIMTEAVAMQQPPSDKGKRLKLYYITQVAVKPPTFVIFVNDKELMHFSYTRYLENKIREAFGFRGTSLKFFIRERKEKDK